MLRPCDWLWQWQKTNGKLVQSEAQKTQASPINQSSKGPVETLIPFIRLFVVKLPENIQTLSRLKKKKIIFLGTWEKRPTNSGMGRPRVNPPKVNVIFPFSI